MNSSLRPALRPLVGPAVRRVVGAMAALALGTGLAAVGAAQAQAADRPTRPARTAELPAGAVDSRLVVSGTGLSVRSEVGPATDLSYVESSLKGKLTIACFAGGAVVPGTGVYAGWATTGWLGGAPWDNSGYYVDTVVRPAATTTSATAAVVLKGILRDRAGDLDALDCAAGSTPGFYRYQVTYLASQRHAFDGTVTGSDKAWPDVSYLFPAPLV